MERFNDRVVVGFENFGVELDRGEVSHNEVLGRSFAPALGHFGHVLFSKSRAGVHDDVGHHGLFTQDLEGVAHPVEQALGVLGL